VRVQARLLTVDLGDLSWKRQPGLDEYANYSAEAAANQDQAREVMAHGERGNADNGAPQQHAYQHLYCLPPMQAKCVEMLLLSKYSGDHQTSPVITH